MNTIKNLAYVGLGAIIVSYIGMLVAFLGFITVFASAVSGTSNGEITHPDFTVFIVGFSVTFVSCIVAGIVRAVLMGMIIAKGFQVGRSGFVGFFADIIKEAGRDGFRNGRDADFRE